MSLFCFNSLCPVVYMSAVNVAAVSLFSVYFGVLASLLLESIKS